ncbi:maltotransferase domain-containing protein [Saccharopolyspora sp. NPDC003752]
MSGRLVVEEVSPVVSLGQHPAKAVVGEHVSVRATVWREGHDALAATVVWRGPDGAGRQTRMTRIDADADLWAATIVPDAQGLWRFRIDAWSDPWATWRHAVEAKLAAGQDESELANDLEIGARLLERVARRPGWDAGTRELLRTAAATLRFPDAGLAHRVEPALSPAVHEAMCAKPVRELLTRGSTHQIWVDRHRALFGSWYEFFPRSTGPVDDDGVAAHGTFPTAQAELERIAGMDFDVVYLPPIHPIGETNRKGRNNSTRAEPGDVGSPWAIGASEGGHDAIHPALGTEDDFDAFVRRAGELDLEVALDLAFQASPDHPWVTEHPDWFTRLPDGSIAFAENPPKKYEDIFPLNFDNDPDGLYAEALDVVRYWIDHGVRIFRVDNPHTKPPNFWHRLIADVKSEHPDVLFLAEAFTRRARLYGLARLGFTQSYTYFTWRDTKRELEEFGHELLEHLHEARPNLFVNTPDILPEYLQHSVPAAFAIRAALAAMLGPSWGVYAGFELFEDHPAAPGGEEYLDSEKYQLRPRDFAAARASGRSLELWLQRLNAIRRRHPALQQLRTLHFHRTDNENIIAFSKTDPASGDLVICVITLDPHDRQAGTLLLDMPELGLDRDARFAVEDLVTGQTWEWGSSNYVEFVPERDIAHIVTVR